MYEVEKYVDVNINRTALMLNLLVNDQDNVKKVVVAASRSIYGEGKYISKDSGLITLIFTQESKWDYVKSYFRGLSDGIRSLRK